MSAIEATLVPRPLTADDFATPTAALQAAIRIGIRSAMVARVNGLGPPHHFSQLVSMGYLMRQRPECESHAIVTAYESAAGSTFDLLAVGLLRIGGLRREVTKA